MNRLRFQDYLAEVGKIRLLEVAEEKILWRQFKQEEDMESRRLLIEHYQPLVVKALSRWRSQDAGMMDLVQEGTIGLIESAENFDPERGVAFSLYAMHRIRGRILNYLEKEGKLSQVSLESGRESQAGMLLTETLTDGALSVAETAERNFMADQLHLAMERLPNKERLALCGTFFAEQEPSQIASLLQISPSHFYRLQKQGIRRVRGMLSRLIFEMKK